MSERVRQPAYPFPLRVPKHPANEPPPTCGDDFAGQMRTFVDVPGYGDGIYCCAPGAADWEQIASLPIDSLTVSDLAGSGDRVVQVTASGELWASGAMTGSGDGFVLVAADGSLFRDDSFPAITRRVGSPATITAGGSNSATVNCNAGELAIAGGCTGSTGLVALYQHERGAASQQWICGGHNYDAVDRTITPTVYCLVNPQ